jgi:hypothetical protein
MKKQEQSKSFAFHFMVALGFVIFTSSCEHLDQLPIPEKLSVQTFYGPTTPLKEGTARAWVSVDTDGNPLSIGVNISERAVQALKKESEENHKEGEEHVTFSLSLPKQAERTLYDHITLDWNPHGHPAPGIYDLPHFDIHVCMISEEERLAIQPLAPFDENGQRQFDEKPALEFIPEDYFLEPGVVPAMGAHWLNSEAPELNEEVFTQTFIYGSHNGEFIFHEPMFTVAYLEDLKKKNNPFESFEIKQPESYQKTGYYPMEYSFTYYPTPGEYRISLDNLMLHQKSMP